MFICKSRYSTLFKAITLVLVCLFVINDIAWAQNSSGYSSSSSSSTLATQSRLKPFFEKYGLDFQNIATVSYVAGELRKMVVSSDIREGNIVRLNNRYFPKGEIEIDSKIETGSLTSGKRYACVTFDFKKEGKQIKALLLKDYTPLTPQDLEELKKFKINNTTDIGHLSCPGLEGVWFINPEFTFVTLSKNPYLIGENKEVLLVGSDTWKDDVKLEKLDEYADTIADDIVRAAELYYSKFKKTPRIALLSYHTTSNKDERIAAADDLSASLSAAYLARFSEIKTRTRKTPRLSKLCLTDNKDNAEFEKAYAQIIERARRLAQAKLKAKGLEAVFVGSGNIQLDAAIFDKAFEKKTGLKISEGRFPPNIFMFPNTQAYESCRAVAEAASGMNKGAGHSAILEGIYKRLAKLPLESLPQIIFPETVNNKGELSGRVIRSALEVAERRAAKVILIFDRKEEIVAQFPKSSGLIKEGRVEILDPRPINDKDDIGLVANLHAARKLLKRFIDKGTPAGMVAGAELDTSQVVITSGWFKTVGDLNDYFLMLFPDRSVGEDGLVLYVNTAVQECPDAKGISDAAISAAAVFRNITTKEPKVALVTTQRNDLDKVNSALQIVKEKYPQAEVTGLDKALKEGFNVVVFPDLMSGNIVYKWTERIGSAKALGPIILGTSVPISDLSRAAGEEDIRDTAAVLASIAAQATRAPAVETSRSHRAGGITAQDAGESAPEIKEGDDHGAFGKASGGVAPSVAFPNMLKKPEQIFGEARSKPGSSGTSKLNESEILPGSPALNVPYLVGRALRNGPDYTHQEALSFIARRLKTSVAAIEKAYPKVTKEIKDELIARRAKKQPDIDRGQIFKRYLEYISEMLAKNPAPGERKHAYALYYYYTRSFKEALEKDDQRLPAATLSSFKKLEKALSGIPGFSRLDGLYSLGKLILKNPEIAPGKIEVPKELQEMIADLGADTSNISMLRGEVISPDEADKGDAETTQKEEVSTAASRARRYEQETGRQEITDLKTLIEEKLYDFECSYAGPGANEGTIYFQVKNINRLIARLAAARRNKAEEMDRLKSDVDGYKKELQRLKEKKKREAEKETTRVPALLKRIEKAKELSQIPQEWEMDPNPTLSKMARERRKKFLDEIDRPRVENILRIIKNSTKSSEITLAMRHDRVRAVKLIAHAKYRELIRKERRKSTSGSTSGEGFIWQGSKSKAEFISRIAEFRKNKLGGLYKARAIKLLSKAIEEIKILELKVSDADQERLKDLLDMLRKPEYHIYGFESIIRGSDDFFLGCHIQETKMIFLATDIIKKLENRSPTGLFYRPTLVDEYLLHELICPVLGHYRAMLVQQKLFPRHYPDKEQLSQQSLDRLYKGLLGSVLRLEIDVVAATPDESIKKLRVTKEAFAAVLTTLEEYIQLVESSGKSTRRAVSYYYCLVTLNILNEKIWMSGRYIDALKERFKKQDEFPTFNEFTRGEAESVEQLNKEAVRVKERLEKFETDLERGHETSRLSLIQAGSRAAHNAAVLDDLGIADPEDLTKKNIAEIALKRGREEAEYETKASDRSIVVSRWGLMSGKQVVEDRIIDFTNRLITSKTTDSILEREARVIRNGEAKAKSDRKIPSISVLRRMEKDYLTGRHKHMRISKEAEKGMKTPIADRLDKLLDSALRDKKKKLGPEVEWIKRTLRKIAGATRMSDISALVEDKHCEIAAAAKARIKELNEIEEAREEAREKARVKEILAAIRNTKAPSDITMEMVTDSSALVRGAAKKKLAELESALVFSPASREKLLKFRQSNGLSQEALGKRLGISGKHLSRIETGVRSPSKELLKKIAELLGMQGKDLLITRKENLPASEPPAASSPRFAGEAGPAASSRLQLNATQQREVERVIAKLGDRIKPASLETVRQVLEAVVLDVDHKNDKAATIALDQHLKNPRPGETDAIIRGVVRIFAMAKENESDANNTKAQHGKPITIGEPSIAISSTLPADMKNLRNVLIFLPAQHIGDEVVYNAPLIARLLSANPNINITMVTINPFIWERDKDKFVPIPVIKKQGLFELGFVLKALRKDRIKLLGQHHRFDMAISIPYYMDIILPSGIADSYVFIDKFEHVNAYDVVKPESEKSGPSGYYPMPSLLLGRTKRRLNEARSALEKIGIAPGEKFVIVNGHSNYTNRCLSTHSSIEIAKSLAKKSGVKICVTADSLDRRFDTAEQFYKTIGEEFRGKIYILPSGSMLKGKEKRWLKYWVNLSELVVTVDTGIAHMSYGMGKKVIIVMATEKVKKMWYPAASDRISFIGDSDLETGPMVCSEDMVEAVVAGAQRLITPTIKDCLQDILFTTMYKEVVKPKTGQRKTQTAYFSSGGNITAPLMSTNADNIIMIDARRFGYKEALPKNFDEDSAKSSYLKELEEDGYVLTDNLPPLLWYPFKWELERLGVYKEHFKKKGSGLKFEDLGDGILKMTFKWKHPDDNEARERTVWFVQEMVEEAFGLDRVGAIEKLRQRGCDIFGSDVLLDKAGEHTLPAVTEFPQHMKKGSIVITDNPHRKISFDQEASLAQVGISEELAVLSRHFGYVTVDSAPGANDSLKQVAIYERTAESPAAQAKADPANIKKLARIKELFGENVVTDELDLDYDFQQAVEAVRRGAFDKVEIDDEYILDWVPYLLGVVSLLTCTARCIHCLMAADGKSRGRMTLEQMAKVFDTRDILVNNPMTHLAGGEVLLYGDKFFQIVRKFPIYSITTNASTMTSPERAGDFARNLKKAFTERAGSSTKGSIRPSADDWFTFDNYQHSWASYGWVRNELIKKMHDSKFKLLISLDDLHLSQSAIKVEKIANLVEAMCAYFPEAEILFIGMKGKWRDNAYPALKKELSKRGFKLQLDKTKEEFKLTRISDNHEVSVNLVENNFGRNGRAIWLPDENFADVTAEEASRAAFGRFKTLGSAFLDYRGNMTLTDTWCAEHAPLMFGNVIEEGWGTVLRRVNRDPLFGALVYKGSFKDKRDNIINMERIIKIAEEYDRGITEDIIHGKPGDTEEFYYWLFSNPERKLYITYRLLKDGFEGGIFKGNNPFNGMSNEDIKRLAQDQVRKLREQYKLKQPAIVVSINATKPKGSCADCLNSIINNPELLHKALTEGFDIEKDLKPARLKLKNPDAPFSDTTIYDREIKPLIDLGILIRLPDDRIKFSDMMMRPNTTGPPDRQYTINLIHQITEIEYPAGVKGEARNKPFHRGEIPPGNRSAIAELVRETVERYRAIQPPHEISNAEINDAVRRALEEDRAREDITTDSTVDENTLGRATIRAKEDGVLAGLKLAMAAFKVVDEKLTLIPQASDGTELKKGGAILVIEGNARSILKAERVALNFLQHLSGITTLTRKFVTEVSGTGVKILDTRKTTPGLRRLEKYAVRIGGGYNHRMGLNDQILIKNNHIAAAEGITNAVERVRREKPSVFIEVETKNLGEVREALECGVDRIMLDNMNVEELKEAVRLVRDRPTGEKNKPEMEASGGITLKKVRAIADTGVSYISIGQITHSAPALDINLRLELNKSVAPDATKPKGPRSFLPDYTGSGNTSVHMTIDIVSKMIVEGNVTKAWEMLEELRADLVKTQQSADVEAALLVLADKWNGKMEVPYGDKLFSNDIPGALSDIEMLLQQLNKKKPRQQPELLKEADNGEFAAHEGPELYIRPGGKFKIGNVSVAVTSLKATTSKLIIGRPCLRCHFVVDIPNGADVVRAEVATSKIRRGHYKGKRNLWFDLFTNEPPKYRADRLYFRHLDDGQLSGYSQVAIRLMPDSTESDIHFTVINPSQVPILIDKKAQPVQGAWQDEFTKVSDTPTQEVRRLGKIAKDILDPCLNDIKEALERITPADNISEDTRASLQKLDAMRKLLKEFSSITKTLEEKNAGISNSNMKIIRSAIKATLNHYLNNKLSVIMSDAEVALARSSLTAESKTRMSDSLAAINTYLQYLANLGELKLGKYGDSTFYIYIPGASTGSVISEFAYTMASFSEGIIKTSPPAQAAGAAVAKPFLDPHSTVFVEVHNTPSYRALVRLTRYAGVKFAKELILFDPSDINLIGRTNAVPSESGELHDRTFNDWPINKEANHVSVIISGNFYDGCVTTAFRDIATWQYRQRLSATYHFIGDQINNGDASKIFSSFTAQNITYKSREYVYLREIGYSDSPVNIYLDGELIFTDKADGNGARLSLYYWTTTDKFSSSITQDASDVVPPSAATDRSEGPSVGSEGPVDTLITNIYDGWKEGKIELTEAVRRIMEEVLPQWAYSDENVVGGEERVIEMLQEVLRCKDAKALKIVLTFAPKTIDVIEKHRRDKEDAELKAELRDLVINMVAVETFFAKYRLLARVRPVVQRIKGASIDSPELNASIEELLELISGDKAIAERGEINQVAINRIQKIYTLHKQYFDKELPSLVHLAHLLVGNAGMEACTNFMRKCLADSDSKGFEKYRGVLINDLQRQEGNLTALGYLLINNRLQDMDVNIATIEKEVFGKVRQETSAKGYTLDRVVSELETKLGIIDSAQTAPPAAAPASLADGSGLPRETQPTARSQAEGAAGSSAVRKERMQAARDNFVRLLAERLRQVTPENMTVETLESALNNNRAELFKALWDWKKIFFFADDSGSSQRGMCQFVAECFSEFLPKIFPSHNIRAVEGLYKPKDGGKQVPHWIVLIDNKIAIDATYGQFDKKYEDRVLVIDADRLAEINWAVITPPGTGSPEDTDCRIIVTYKKLQAQQINEEEAARKVMYALYGWVDSEENLLNDVTARDILALAQEAPLARVAIEILDRHKGSTDQTKLREELKPILIQWKNIEEDISQPLGGPCRIYFEEILAAKILSETEERIIRELCGPDGEYTGKSLSDIAREMGKTAENVRQHKEIAIAKIRIWFRKTGVKVEVRSDESAIQKLLFSTEEIYEAKRRAIIADLYESPSAEAVARKHNISAVITLFIKAHPYDFEYNGPTHNIDSSMSEKVYLEIDKVILGSIRWLSEGVGSYIKISPFGEQSLIELISQRTQLKTEIVEEHVSHSFRIQAAVAILASMVQDELTRREVRQRVRKARREKRYPITDEQTHASYYAAAEAESKAMIIHTENLKLTPVIPEKTILCHIIMDSIVPEGQRNMLKMLEKEMRSSEYRYEKVVSLSIKSPDNFIKELSALMARQRNLYKDCVVQFDVACPDPALVKAVLEADLGVKALAFKPYEWGEFTVVQVEGIILALRALHSGDMERLKAAFVFLTGNKLSVEESAMTDIDQFIRAVTFMLPASKMADYGRRKTINDLITTYIKQAA